MNITEFNTKRHSLEIEGSGITTTTTSVRTWSDKVTKQPTFEIPSGVTVHVWFSPKKHPSNIFVKYGDEVKISRITQAHTWLNGFRKPPTFKTLEKYSNNGIAKTPLGNSTEPDGYDSQGAPSWMLVLGLI